MSEAKSETRRTYNIPVLDADDIEVKVKQVGKKGTTVLLYKTSRVDMRILDEVFGPNNWQVDYQMIDDMLFCTIYVWDEEKKMWIHKQSNGIESRADGEGNEKKGWSSDAMKRAGFMFGIGRELYSAPFTFISASKMPVKQDESKPGRWVLENPFVKLAVSDIGYDEKRKIIRLVIVDRSSGEIMYTYGTNDQNKTRKPTTTTKPAKEKTETVPVKTESNNKEATKSNAVVTTGGALPQANQPQYLIIYRGFLKKHGIDKNKFVELRAKAVADGKKVTDKDFKELTEEEWIELLANLESLYVEGYFKDAV